METVLTSGILTSLPGRYAKALFDLACEEGEVSRVGASLRSLEKLIQSLPVLKHALASPTLQREEQASALTQICVLLKAPELVQSFARQLVKAQRIDYLSKIDTIYQSLVSHTKGEQNVAVISAYPLTSSQSALLEDTLKKKISGVLKLTFVNDPKVLGGMMIRVGSRVIDATLVTQLSQLSTVMKGNA